MAKYKSADGVFHRRTAQGGFAYYWKIGKDKSREFSSKIDCAKDYIERYIDRHPKYKEAVYDKSWEEIFRIFGIAIS